MSKDKSRSKSGHTNIYKHGPGWSVQVPDGAFKYLAMDEDISPRWNRPSNIETD